MRATLNSEVTVNKQVSADPPSTSHNVQMVAASKMHESGKYISRMLDGLLLFVCSRYESTLNMTALATANAGADIDIATYLA